MREEWVLSQESESNTSLINSLHNFSKMPRYVHEGGEHSDTCINQTLNASTMRCS